MVDKINRQLKAMFYQYSNRMCNIVNNKLGQSKKSILIEEYTYELIFDVCNKIHGEVNKELEYVKQRTTKS